jgi:hypothetical protein
MPVAPGSSFAVIDFRRHSMLLNWHTRSGCWSPCETNAPLVHGAALIRPQTPNICLYGEGGILYLQVGTDRFPLSAGEPHIICARSWRSFGLRHRCVIESNQRKAMFSLSYWDERGPNFFRWLVEKAADPAWRTDRARAWTEGVTPAALRAG